MDDKLQQYVAGGVDISESGAKALLQLEQDNPGLGQAAIVGYALVALLQMENLHREIERRIAVVALDMDGDPIGTYVEVALSGLPA